MYRLESFSKTTQIKEEIKKKTKERRRDRPMPLVEREREKRERTRMRMRMGCHLWWLCQWTFIWVLATPAPLRFRTDRGEFKILQVADMHYGNGRDTGCLDVKHNEHCSDLNTTAFIKRLIDAEQPDFIVFSGDNIFGSDCKNVRESLRSAFSPAIEAKISWAAILGNHDQEPRQPSFIEALRQYFSNFLISKHSIGSLSNRHGVMQMVAKLDYTMAQVYPEGSNVTLNHIDGFGNYHLEVHGAVDSPLANKSVLNLFFLDSGDYAPHYIGGYGWIQESQKQWFIQQSQKLQADFMEGSGDKSLQASSLVYFHIPLPEVDQLKSGTGTKLEGVSCPGHNSGFLHAMESVGDVRAAFFGHDHLNDFCGISGGGVQLCYAGAAGYHAYGRLGWPRRARVVSVTLANEDGTWKDVHGITTWKRLDDAQLTLIDNQLLWTPNSILT